MADDVLVDNGSNTDFTVDTVELSGGSHVQTVELVLPVSGGAKASVVKSEDAAHASGDPGIMMLAVRKDTASALATTDANYIPLIVDSSGRLHVAPIPAGTSNIGDVDVLTEPALDLSTDQAGASLMVNVLMNDRTELTPAFGIIDVASSGDNTLLAAQGASNKIRVHSVFLMAASAVNVRFESGASGTALTGQMNLAANGGFVLPFNPVGWFETAANTLLNLELSGAVSVDGCFQYTVLQ